ncbi:peptidoglycan-binding protein LysM [Empedobacter brevis]|uniref:peptidoglycan-binding protein LysM n=1 Tax=Empedobacter brevis TaxID=247 RepID=UPI0039AFCA64
MGLFSFIKNAGEKVFGGAETPEEKANKVKDQVAKQGFDLSGVTFSADGDKIVVAGEVLDINEKQKILATAGNIDGVEEVEDKLTLKTPLKIEIPDISKTMYTVKSGDSLSKIAKEVYGDPMQYPKIFEANKPMLKHEDKIYPGQVLYIPQD